MAVYMYQVAYSPESIAAQIRNPQDRIEVARSLVEAIEGRLLAAGYSFGEYDFTVVFEAPDDQSAAALAMTVTAGGAIRAGKTTKLLAGSEWVSSLQKASGIGARYRPPL